MIARTCVRSANSKTTPRTFSLTLSPSLSLSQTLPARSFLSFSLFLSLPYHSRFALPHMSVAREVTGSSSIHSHSRLRESSFIKLRLSTYASTTYRLFDSGPTTLSACKYSRLSECQYHLEIGRNVRQYTSVNLHHSWISDSHVV